MKATTDIYRVKPTHFDHMTYWEALREKIKLADISMKAIHDEASTLTYGCAEYDRLFDIYQTASESKRFNEFLLNERKQYAKNKKDGGFQIHSKRNDDTR